MAINDLVPFVSFCCNVVVVSVLMLIFLSVVLARTLKKIYIKGLKGMETATTLFLLRPSHTD